MDLSDSSDEESTNLEYWNNWRPQVDDQPTTVIKKTDKVVFVSKSNVIKEKSVSSMKCTEKFGNWIPPVELDNEKDFVTSSKETNKSKRFTMEKDFINIKRFDQSTVHLNPSELFDTNSNNNLNINKIMNKSAKNVFNVKRYLDKTGFDLLSESKYLDRSVEDVDEFLKKEDSNVLDKCTKWEKVLNSDWGKRAELHDVTNFSDGDTFWGVICPGVFGLIKLWENQYGNICGSAVGKISKEGIPEMSYIFINDSQILRKLLNLTKNQWAALVEMTQKNKITLKFDALTDYNLQKMCSLEKLWYFTCKKRHFLSDLCVLVKFSGAIKSMQDFKIIPKLVVQEIRDISGQNIL